MNIIIVGCGKVGQTLTKELCEEGNDLTVIDIEAENLRAITDLDVMSVVGNGATFAVQKRQVLKKPTCLSLLPTRMSSTFCAA